MAGLLDRERIIAGPGFNRWLVPPAALAIHLSIGQAYAYSVFKLPLTRLLGVTAPGTGDWSQTEGAFAYRLPPPDWKPAGWIAPAGAGAMITSRHVHVAEGWTTPQFVMLWVVLCANVSAGIGVLEQASPMIQEIFRGRVTASAAAGFVGLLSLFNIAGRIAWASLSDHIGR